MPPAARPSRLRPTFTHAPAGRYRRPGGPWDRGALTESLAAPGARPAVVDDDLRLSGAALRAAVDQAARAMAAGGVRRGTVVAWQLPNSAAAVVLYRACWQLGAIAAPVHHRMGTAEAASALEQVAPALVVAARGLACAEPGVAEAAAVDGARHRAPSLLVVGTGPPATGRSSSGSVPALLQALAGWVSSRSPASCGAPATVRGGDLAVVLFTSGSTGRPKAVLHTHRGLGYKAVLMARAHGLGADDAVLMPAPLAHISGLLNGVLLPGVLGVPAVLMAAWDPERALARIEQERVTFMGAPPVFFSQMAAEAGFRRERVASLRLVSTGGASVSPAFVDATSDRFGCRVKRTYGSTEAPTVTTSGPDDPPARARDFDGRPVGEAELRVVTPGSTQPLPAGQPGEILLRGPELFVGYADAAATAAVRRPGGWLATGDLGVVDEAGWLSVVGRLSDIIIRAGENISASEVEAALESHPAVRGAVAVPVPDPVVGERVAAYVEAVAPFDLAACREWFDRQGMSRFKTPEHVVVVDHLPVLATGKPDRAALRARAAAELAC